LPANQNGDGSATITLVVTKNGCVNEATTTIHINDIPEVTDVETVNPTCGEDNGSIIISFVDNPDRSNIEFSINGVSGPYTEVPDNSGSITFNNLDAGNYDLYVRWGNSDCPIDLEDVTISDELAPTVVASDDVTICVGGMVTLTANGSGGTGNLSFSWMPGNGSGTSFDVSPTETTTYTVTVEDVNGCTNSDQVTVTVVDDPSIDIVADGTNICEGGSIMLTSMVSGGLDCEDVRWERRMGMSGPFTQVATGGSYNTDANLAPGTYQFRARYVCAGVGCDDDDSNIITITVEPDPQEAVEIPAKARQPLSTAGKRESKRGIDLSDHNAC
ncbi:MAG: hypothetical protein AAF811_15690, partial [Pseudomonadota bacterium]